MKDNIKNNKSNKSYNNTNNKCNNIAIITIMTFSKIAIERERITAAGGIVQQDQTDEFSGSEGAWRVRGVEIIFCICVWFCFGFGRCFLRPCYLHCDRHACAGLVQAPRGARRRRPDHVPQVPCVA